MLCIRPLIYRPIIKKLKDLTINWPIPRRRLIAIVRYWLKQFMEVVPDKHDGWDDGCGAPLFAFHDPPMSYDVKTAEEQGGEAQTDCGTKIRRLL